MSGMDWNALPELMGSRLLTRAGIGSSILVHVALLTWIVFGTGAQPFNPSPAEAITVELVTPKQAEMETKKEAEPAKKEDTLTDLDLSIPKPKPDTTDTPVKSSPQAQVKNAPPPPAPPPAAAKQPPPPPPAQQAAAKQAPPPPPTPAQPPAPAQDVAPPVAQPDITEKYGTLFSMSDIGFSIDTTAAKIESSAVDKFRAHLKTCSVLPGGVAATDKVRIVLRVVMLPGGTLAAPPALIEASASAKGPALMQGAIKALQSCQPYTMLPADKYNEWRTLNLSFTPADFQG